MFAVHEQLILGFIVGGQNKSVSVVEEDGYRLDRRTR